MFMNRFIEISLYHKIESKKKSSSSYLEVFPCALGIQSDVVPRLEDDPPDRYMPDMLDLIICH